MSQEEAAFILKTILNDLRGKRRDLSYTPTKTQIYEAFELAIAALEAEQKE